MTHDAYRSRHFDDLVVGERFESRWISLSTDEMVRFSNEYDRQYFHTDEQLAQESPFGGLIASGAHTFAVWNRLNLEVNGDIAWIAGMGFDEFRFPNPVRPGIEFRSVSTLMSKRPSASHVGRGVVVHHHQLVTATTTCCSPASTRRWSTALTYDWTVSAEYSFDRPQGSASEERRTLQRVGLERPDSESRH